MPDNTPTLTTTQVGNLPPILKSEPAILENEVEKSPVATHHAVIAAAHLMTFSISCVILFFGKVVFIPLALALLFTFMLNPTVKILQRMRFSRTWAAIAVVTVAFAFLLGAGYFIGTQISALARELPQHRENIIKKVQSVKTIFRGGTVAEFQSTVASVTVDIKNKDREDKLAEEKARAEAEVIRIKAEKVMRKVYLLGFSQSGGVVAGIQEAVSQAAEEIEKVAGENKTAEEKAVKEAEAAHLNPDSGKATVVIVPANGGPAEVVTSPIWGRLTRCCRSWKT